MASMSNEVLAERLNTHIESDKDKHDALEESSGTLLREVAKLSTRVEVLNATLAPVIEHYMAEHPSKVQNIQASLSAAPGAKPKRRAVSQEIKVLGALVTFLTIASQALQAWISHH